MQQTTSGWSYRVFRRAAGWRWEVVRHGECLASGDQLSAVRARAEALQAASRMAHRPGATIALTRAETAERGQSA